MLYFLLVLSIAAAVFKNLIARMGETEFSGFTAINKLNTVTAAVTIIICFVGGGRFNGGLSPFNMALAVINGICSIFAQALYFKSVQLGSVSISSLFYASGFLIPTVWGAVYYKEEVKILQIAALIILLVSLYLGNEKTEGKFNIKWLVTALAAMVFSGLLGVFQKLFAESEQGGRLTDFLLIEFTAMLIISGVIQLFTGTKTAGSKKKFYSLAIITGICTGFINIINIYLSGALPSIIVFPVINGGIIIFTTVAAMLFFKEKLTTTQKISVLLGLVSIVIIGVI